MLDRIQLVLASITELISLQWSRNNDSCLDEISFFSFFFFQSLIHAIHHFLESRVLLVSPDMTRNTVNPLLSLFGFCPGSFWFGTLRPEFDRARETVVVTKSAYSACLV
jgi:hypothetical protein